MTLIVSWAALDQKGKVFDIASMYIMSESRISWETQGIRDNWDNGRKLFSFSKHPDILGYCGEVSFVIQALSQVVSLGDAGILFNSSETFINKSSVIFDQLQYLLQEYPKRRMLPSFSIMHCGKSLNGEFGCRKFHWGKKDGWSIIDIDFYAGIDDRGVLVEGSGAVEFTTLYDKKFQDKTKRVNSREIYQCFIETLSNIKDPNCGGPPQLAGVYRGNFAKTFGIIHNNRRFALGIEVPDNAVLGTELDDMEWRNELFERCNPVTKAIMSGAQRQPRV